MKKLIIFDLDGTLFDTTLSMVACGNEALEKLHLPLLTPKDYARFSGAGVEGYVHAILDAVGDKEHKYAKVFWEYYTEKNEAEQLDLIHPYEGVRELLSALKEKGIRLAVLSNKNEEACIPTVHSFFGEEVFDVIWGDKEGFAPKPDPENVLKMMNLFSVKKEDCLYVGDTQVDMKTGKNAKIDTVAALWGYREKEDLAVFSPEYYAEKPLDILSLVGEK